MIEVDRLMIEEYDIDLIQMMENAGRGLLPKQGLLNKSSYPREAGLLFLGDISIHPCAVCRTEFKFGSMLGYFRKIG